MSASLCSVAPKIWLALPTSAVPFITPRVSVEAKRTPQSTAPEAVTKRLAEVRAWLTVVLR